ncbi:MAG TPA: 2-oxoglutarate dehydrogenase complex dihydrolipoyllysine-residue succinyltransferase [Saprospiraceae bacterium]|nr:2-oxoglutarate dehydrogenase complex dihydrolipoyllysine-residue succinyltransferase [Saprospiraceae bacterium]
MSNIVEMRVPTIGESITEVTLSQWLKKDGDFVKLDEPICEFESDKATLEFPAEAEGKLIYVAKEGDDLEIGALVAKIDTSATQSNATQSEEKPKVENTKVAEQVITTPSTNDSMKGVASPAAAKILREKEIDPSSVDGSGKDGRITKGDALVAEKTNAEKMANDNISSVSTTATFGRTERVEKMSRMRRTIASRLVSAKNQTAMLTTFNEVDLSKIMQLRKDYQEDFVAKYGIKLGFMSLFSKACAQVLMEMPDVNARIDENNIIYHDYVDISIAISTPNGLVVPPVKNVQAMKLHEIEYAIKELAAKARDGKLSLEEMKGGTFTITNGGVFGSLVSTPIINEPQSAILGMHAIQERPVAVDGKVEIRPMMYLALSYDHRIIDGSTSVTYLVKVKQLLEDPVKLLMEL